MILNALLRFATIWFFVISPATAWAQTAISPSAGRDSHSLVIAQLVALRNSFVAQIKAEGFRPSLPPPQIIPDNPPSYGEYDDSKNVLHIAVWEALSPEQRALFSGMAHQGETGEQTFEESVHHWVFIHELSHWWQACQHKIGQDHYSVEYGANRIAAAYWRLKDPAIMEINATRMAAVRASMPNPVFQGMQKEDYFNKNYEQLGPTPAYIWFQCDMVLEILAERPMPSFRKALQQPTFP